MNVGVRVPPPDMCVDCKTLADQALADLKEAYTKARQVYKADKAIALSDPGHIFYAVDLQKVVSLPIIPKSKEVIFAPGIITYNETFAAMQPDTKNVRKDFCVTWNESLQKRNAEDIASTFIKVMKTCPAQKFTFWMDNCTAQNKNWKLFCAMALFLRHNDVGTKEITFKYLTKGHTFNRCDSIHGLIEQEIRRRETVVDPTNFADVLDCASVGTAAVKMEEDDFLDFEKISAGRLPIMHSITEVIFTSADPFGMGFKFDFNDSVQRATLIKRSANLSWPSRKAVVRMDQGKVLEMKKQLWKVLKLDSASSSKWWRDLFQNCDNV